jgi:hypothetical protein
VHVGVVLSRRRRHGADPMPAGAGAGYLVLRQRPGVLEWPGNAATRRSSTPDTPVDPAPRPPSVAPSPGLPPPLKLSDVASQRIGRALARVGRARPGGDFLSPVPLLSEAGARRSGPGEAHRGRRTRRPPPTPAGCRRRTRSMPPARPPTPRPRACPVGVGWRPRVHRGRRRSNRRVRGRVHGAGEDGRAPGRAVTAASRRGRRSRPAPRFPWGHPWGHADAFRAVRAPGAPHGYGDSHNHAVPNGPCRVRTRVW